MKYYILASGSKGNATVFESGQSRLLIDQGLSLKEFKNRLSIFNVNSDDINAVLYTHNHIDHFQKLLFNKIGNGNVYAPSNMIPDGVPYTLVIPYIPFMVNDFKVTPLATSHDAPNSVGYILETADYKVVYITDTGYISTKNLEMMKDAHLYIIESNHNIKMLLQTNRTFELKQRILSDTGHLSNESTAHYLVELIGPNTREIILAHLSEEANTPEVALATLDQVFRKYGVDQTNLKIRAAAQHVPMHGDLSEN